MLQTSPKKTYNYSCVNSTQNGRKNNNNNRNRNNVSLSTLLSFLIIIVFCITLTASYIYQFVQIAHLNYDINNLDTQLSELRVENNALSLALAKERSIVRIENIARSELGMVEPDDVKIVILNNNGQDYDEHILSNKEPIFFARFFTNILNVIGTAKAEELE
ncbi:FtsB family cell division protein [Natronospora cellulosivora (SeqCode)]